MTRFLGLRHRPAARGPKSNLRRVALGMYLSVKNVAFKSLSHRQGGAFLGRKLILKGVTLNLLTPKAAKTAAVRQLRLKEVTTVKRLYPFTGQ